MLSLLIVFLLVPINTGAVTVDGLVAYRGDFLSGARVYALAEPLFEIGEKALHVSGPTDADGRFTMDLAPGKYYLTALKKGPGEKELPEPGDYFCFYSGNPVRVVEGQTLHVGFSMVVVPGDGDMAEGYAGIEGRMVYEDEPIGRAYVYVYNDSSDEFRGMGFYTAPIGPDGKFRLRLPPGKYYLIARKRQQGGMFGPLQKNDLVGYYYGNPVKVVEGSYRQVVIEAIRKVEMLEEIWFEKETAGAFIISGRAADGAGRLLAGLYILLYDNKEAAGKPKFISSKTDEEGRFRLELYDEGVYYLIARENLGGPPVEEEYYGRYLSKEGDLAPLSLEKGGTEIELDLTIERYTLR